MSPAGAARTPDEPIDWGIPQALLATLGPARGRTVDSGAILLTGATESRRWLLAAHLIERLLCEAESDEPPCGRCWSCRQRKAGHAHPDLRIIAEEPEQIGIDEIRSLEDALALTAHRGGWKVGWIPRANRLTEGAANAFLKTLEEPPPHAFYLMESGRPRALKATLRSRCQRWTLHAPETGSGLGTPEWEALVGEWASECERMFQGETSPLVWVRERPPLTWADQARLWSQCLWTTSRARLGWPVRTRLPQILERRLGALPVESLELLYTRARETERMAQAGINQRLALEALVVGITREVNRHASKLD
jgi:hypothetical protein